MNRFLFILTLTLLFAACKNEPSKKQNVQNAKPADSHEGHAHVKASADGPLVGVWEYTFAMGINDKGVGERYADRWIEMKMDNTFESGIGVDQNNKGTWSFDDNTKFIDLNYETKEDGLADQFKVQGIGGLEVIWKGNTPRNPRGLTIKMTKLPNRPQ